MSFPGKSLSKITYYLTVIRDNFQSEEQGKGKVPCPDSRFVARALQVTLWKFNPLPIHL
jgi:hypothetical protein